MSDDDVKGIAGVVGPIVHDLTRPVMKEIGGALQKTVHAFLLPVYRGLEGFEAVVNWVAEETTQRLWDVPPEDVKEPAAYVAGPALEALRFAMDEQELRSLYAALLATAMHRPSSSNAHPAFVEIIKQLTPDEARIIRVFADGLARPMLNLNKIGPLAPGLVSPSSTVAGEGFQIVDEEVGLRGVPAFPTYLMNLIRLGLLEMPPNLRIAVNETYAEIEAHEEIKQLRAEVEAEGCRLEIVRRMIRLTPLGHQFLRACVLPLQITDSQ